MKIFIVITTNLIEKSKELLCSALRLDIIEQDKVIEAASIRLVLGF